MSGCQGGGVLTPQEIRLRIVEKLIPTLSAHALSDPQHVEKIATQVERYVLDGKSEVSTEVGGPSEPKPRKPRKPDTPTDPFA